MMYIGIDLHKEYSYVTRMNEKGTILAQDRVEHDPESLEAFVGSLDKDDSIAVEATGNWYYLYELLEGKTPNISLAHPLKTRVIAEARIKTDKISSGVLAHLLRTDLLPKAYIPNRETRDLRETLRYRASLVKVRTQLKNKVHSILSKNGVSSTAQTPFQNSKLIPLAVLSRIRHPSRTPNPCTKATKPISVPFPPSQIFPKWRFLHIPRN